MKKTQLFSLLTLLGLVPLADAARYVGKDFAPLRTWHASTDEAQPMAANGIGLGWFTEGATVDGQALDYTKVQHDEDYARKAYDQNIELLDSQTTNVIYSIETGKSLSNVTKPKFGTPEEDVYAACYEGASFGSLRRDCDIDYEPASGFVIIQVNYKWNSGSAQAIQIKADRDGNKKAVAWGDLTQDINTLFSKALEKQFGAVPEYQADKEKLVYLFNIKGIDKGDSENTALVTGTGEAYVPRGDVEGFSGSLKATVKLVAKGEDVKVVKLPSVVK